MLFPFKPNQRAQRADDPQCRAEAEAFNRLALDAAAALDRRIAAGDPGWRQIDFADVADELEVPIDLVREALHRGNANGLTIFVSEEEHRALKMLQAKRGLH